MSKPIKIGLCTVRDERKTIAGWLKMLDHFCDQIVILLDPETADGTKEFLDGVKSINASIKIEYQDRSLGDSDNKSAGKTGRTIMHLNKSKWINENIDDGDWFIDMVCDERFSICDYTALENEIEFCKNHGLDSIIHRTMYEPLPANLNQILTKGNQIFVDTEIKYNGKNEVENCYSIDWTGIHHIRFQRKNGTWVQNATPHSSFQGQGFAPLYSNVPLWHFHRIKENSQLPVNWRDAKGSISRLLKYYKGKIPVIPVCCNFNWETMEPETSNITDFTILQSQLQITAKNAEIAESIHAYRDEHDTEIHKFVPYFQLQIPKKQITMLLIGTNTQHSPTTQSYYNIFRRMGINVVWAGVGAKDLDLSNVPQKMMVFNGLQGRYPVVYREMKLQSILDIFSGIKFDCIVHFQDQIYFTEDKPSNIPNLYILGQTYSPRISKTTSLVLCSTKNAIRQVKYYNGNEFPVGYLPPSLREDFYNIHTELPFEREFLLSFAGEMYTPDVYAERRKIVLGVYENLKCGTFKNEFHWMSPPDEKGNRTIEMGKGRLNAGEYQELLMVTKYGLSCQTESGMCFRDLEIPACGAILVTKRTPDLDVLGFKHGINCYFYETVNDVLDILMKGWDQNIADAGYALANKQTVQSRANEIIGIIEKMLS